MVKARSKTVEDLQCLFPNRCLEHPPVPVKGGLVEVNDEWADVVAGFDSGRAGQPCQASVCIQEVDQCEGDVFWVPG